MHICSLRSAQTLNDQIRSGKCDFGRWVNITGNQSIILCWEGLPGSDEKSNLTIGNFVSIGDKCTFFLGGHHRSDWFCQHLLPDLTEPKPDEIVSKGDVSIGSDVWIGYGATILAGTDIPHGCIVGAMSVVSGKFEPYDVIVGNPGKVIKKRFDQPTIDILLELKWWDWALEKITQHSDILKSNDIERLKALLPDR